MDPVEPARRRPRVRRLILRDFRSYATLDARFDSGLIAYGEIGRAASTQSPFGAMRGEFEVPED